MKNQKKKSYLTGGFWTAVTNDIYIGVTTHWIDDSQTPQNVVINIREVRTKDILQAYVQMILDRERTADQ